METDWFELLCVMHFDVSSTHFLICFHSVRMVTALSTETFTTFTFSVQLHFSGQIHKCLIDFLSQLAMLQGEGRAAFWSPAAI